jgi:general secretion pathway protein G
MARGKIAPIELAIKAYILNTGSLPRSLDDLRTPPKGLENVWAGPYLKESQLYDPWGNMYEYDYGFRLQSCGADGKPGGEGENADIEKFTSTSENK